MIPKEVVELNGIHTATCRMQRISIGTHFDRDVHVLADISANCALQFRRVFRIDPFPVSANTLSPFLGNKIQFNVISLKLFAYGNGPSL